MLEIVSLLFKKCDVWTNNFLASIEEIVKWEGCKKKQA